MSPPLADLFRRLRSPEAQRQSEAVAQLAMLLEKSAHPGRDPATWKLVLPRALLQLDLSPEEIRRALREAVLLADSPGLYRGNRLSLIGLIARDSTAEVAEAVLKFVNQVVDSLDEPEAYALLADFATFLEAQADTGRIQPLIKRWRTVQSVQALQRIGSQRLRESLARVLAHLASIDKN